MRTRLWGSIFFATLLYTSHPANAATLGALNYGGDACPQGTVSAGLTGTGLQISFSSNRAQAGSSSGRPSAQASCTVNVSIRMTPNTQASVQSVRAAGYNRLPQGATSQVVVDHYFAGGRAPRVAQSFAGALSQGFQLMDQAGPQTKFWSPCGQEAILRVSSLLQVNNGSRQGDAAVGLDQGGLSYAIEYRPCR